MSLIAHVLIAVVGLIVLMARFKLHAFVAIVLAAIYVGVAAGMEPRAVMTAFQDGMGAILGSVGAVIGLGLVMGKMLEVSGGAQVVASTLIGWFGPRRLPWAMLAIAIVVGLPVFFTVGIVLLAPILFAVARASRAPLLTLGVPVLAGLSVMHGLVPPHPGPMVAADVFKADIGRTILYSLLVGLPTAAVAGPLFGAFISRRVAVAVPDAVAATAMPLHRSVPGFGLTILTVVVPVLLMLLATLADVTLPPADRLRQVADFLGHPVVALLVAVLVAFYSFGLARGFDRSARLRFTEDCLGPGASILLIVGAGGGFNRVLVTSGVGSAVAAVAASADVSVLVLGWLVAAAIRLAAGSATVAITTAAGIVAPVAAGQAVSPELLVIAMGAGSVIASHLNDGGFWFVKEYYGMTVAQTLKTWTVVEVIIAVVALAFVLLLDLLL